MTQLLTQLEFTPEDFDVAKKMARHLGYSETVYTTSSALWGLFCLSTHRRGCIIKTEELGLLFVQDAEDIMM